MAHDVLIPIVILVSIPPLLPLLLIGAWSTSKREINFEIRRKTKEALLMARLPHCVYLFRLLLIAIQDNKPEDEIKKRVKEISDYITFIAR